MTDPNDREPRVSRHGRAYASLLDGNLLLHVNEKSLFDLTEQDGRDVIATLRDLVGDDARQQYAEEIAQAIEAQAEKVKAGAFNESAGIALAAVLADGARIAREYGEKAW